MSTRQKRIVWASVVIFFFSWVNFTVCSAQVADMSSWFKEKAKPFQGETITVITSSGLGFVPSLEYAGKKFEKMVGVKVKVLTLPWLQLHDKIMANCMAGVSPYDVALIDGWPAPSIYSAGAFHELKPFLNSDLSYPKLDMDDFVQNDIKYNCTFPPGETLYALPYFSDIMMLFYNREYLEKTGFEPPVTWEDWEKIVKSLYARDLDDDGKVEYGTALVAKPNCHDIPATFHNRFSALGGEWFDEEMKPGFNNEVGLRALNMFIRHLEYAAPGSVTFDIPMQDEAFIHGDVAMMEGWTYVPGLANNPERSDIVGKCGVTLLPRAIRYGPLYGGWGIGLPRYAKHTKAGFLFIQWATTKEMMKEVALNTGITPARKSCLEDPKCLEKFPWYKELLRSLQVGIPVPKIPEEVEVWDSYTRHLSAAISGEASPEKALERMYYEVYGIMKKAGYYKK